MNKKLLLNEIKETGFYCIIDDKEREIIFEIINNTDDGWLKENPNDKFLIDEWIYDYTDYDDRKVYGTNDSLISIDNAEPLEVYKLKNKYKMFGQMGQYLIEDRPTYKELYRTKKQECKKLKQEVKKLKEWQEANQPTGICETCTAKSVIYSDKCQKALDGIGKLIRNDLINAGLGHIILNIIDKVEEE